MKLKKDYILKTVAGEHIVVPIGVEATKFHGMITLNETGKFLFENLKEETTEEILIMKLLESYDVTPSRAKTDVDKFLGLLKKHNLFEN